jgi:hypothetical protein
MTKKILMFALLTMTAYAENFTANMKVKYWSMPTMNYKDTITGEKDFLTYKRWLKATPTDLAIINNVTDKFVIDRYASFYIPVCSRELTEDKTKKVCIYKSPTMPKKVSITVINGERGTKYKIDPVMFVLNKQMGIIVVSTDDDDDDNINIPELKKYFSERSRINNENIIVVGSFKAESINALAGTEEKSRISTGTKIIDTGLTSSENIITAKVSPIVTNEVVSYDVMLFDKKYSGKNKTENQLAFKKYVSEYYPLQFQLNFDFKERK